MAVFAGGSAYNMAQSIADGYIIPTELTFKSFKDPDLQTFLFEAEKLLREIRGSQTPVNDVQAAQNRQRRMARMTQVITLANAIRSRRR